MKRFLLVLVWLSWAQPAVGQTAFFGPGANSCSLFKELHEMDPGIHEIAFFAWAQGFMSGMNAFALRAGEPITDLRPSGYDQDRQREFLHLFCEAHPVRPFVQGVFNLMTELRNSGGALE